MKVAILTENFIGQYGDFTHLKNDLIGGAEIYLYELIKRVLEPPFNEVTVYQTYGLNKIFHKTSVVTIPSFYDVDLKDFDLIIVNRLELLKKLANLLSRDLKVIGIHHGMRLNPTIFNIDTLRIIWKYQISTHGTWRSEKILEKYFKNDKLLKVTRLLRQLIALGHFSFRNEICRFHTIKSLNDVNAQCVVSVDKDSLKYILPSKRKGWTVIYNFVDLDLFNPNVKPKFDFGDSKTNILVPRNLSFGRGVFILPELAHFLKKRNCNFRFLVTGDGSLKQYLEAFADDNIILLGHQDHFSDMPRLFASSDIVLVPSFCSEGTSLAVLEGMASKKPVVTTNVGGIKDIGINGVHKLSSSFNVKKIGMNLLRLMKDEKLFKKISENAYRYVCEKHNIQLWTDKWKKVITSALWTN